LRAGAARERGHDIFAIPAWRAAGARAPFVERSAANGAQHQLHRLRGGLRRPLVFQSRLSAALWCHSLRHSHGGAARALTREAAMSNPPDFAVMHCSTEALPVRERVPVLREFIGPIISRMEIEPPGDGPLYFELSARAVPDLAVSKLAFSAIRGERT